jgi:hypothetical protein
VRTILFFQSHGLMQLVWSNSQVLWLIWWSKLTFIKISNSYNFLFSDQRSSPVSCYSPQSHLLHWTSGNSNNNNDCIVLAQRKNQALGLICGKLFFHSISGLELILRWNLIICTLEISGETSNEKTHRVSRAAALQKLDIYHGTQCDCPTWLFAVTRWKKN